MPSGQGRQDNEISLKGQSPTWRGFTDTSSREPSQGSFGVLRNCYVSRDGTELVTSLGARKSGRPFYLDMPEDWRQAANQTKGGFELTSVSATSPMIANARTGRAIASHWMKIRVMAGEYGYLIRSEGLGGLTQLADGFYRAEAIDVDTMAIDFNNTATTVSATPSGEIWICRLPVELRQTFGQTQMAGPWAIHCLTQVGDYPMVLTDVEAWSDGTGKRRHLGAWVGQHPLSFDFPESVYRHWFSPNVTPWSSDINRLWMVAGRVSGSTIIQDIYDMPVRRRMMVDVSNDDALVAVPGHALCYRVPVSAKAARRNMSRFVMPLGVPKCMVALVTGVNDGSGTFSSGDSFWVSVGYRNIYTGELGLASDPVEYTIASGQNTLLIHVWSVRELMIEAGDYAYVVYLSAEGASDSGAMFMVGEFPHTNTEFGTHLIRVFDATKLADRFPVIEQYPYGAGFIKTVKGITIGGGMISSGLLDTNLDVERLLVQGAVGTNEIMIVQGNNLSATPAAGARMQGQAKLSNAMAGFEAIMGTAFGSTVDASRVRLVRQVPQDTPGAASASSNRFEFEGEFQATWPGSGLEVDMHLLMPRGQVWFSEIGAPGVVTGISRSIIDRIRGKDFRSAARVGEAILLHTELETYVLRWGRSPIGEDPQLVTDAYGCIAPASVVEFEGTVAWISHMGPVAFRNGGIDWIGSRIYSYFKTLKRDSRGQMLHVHGVHDHRRRLVMWFVRSDWDGQVSTQYLQYSHASNTDDDKSRFPADEVLIWNYVADSFSVQRFAQDRWVCASGRMRHDDGEYRTAFVSSMRNIEDLVGQTATTMGYVPAEFHDIYSLEDGFADHRDRPLEVTAIVGPSESGGSTYFVGAPGSFIGHRLNNSAAFIRTGDDVLEWVGTCGPVTTVSGANDAVEIYSPGNSTWAAGAVIEIGILPDMAAETHRYRIGEYGRKYSINSLTIRHELTRPYPGTSLFHGWVRAYAIHEDGTQVNFYDSEGAEPNGKLLEGSQTKLDTGTLQGNDLKIGFEITTDGVVKIKDIVLEVNAGA